MSAQPITPEVRAWIVEQARAGCQPADVLRALQQSGWHEAVAVQAIEETLEAYLAQQHTAGSEVVAKPRPVLADHPVPAPDACDVDVQVVLKLQRPELVVLSGLLTRDECDALIDLARSRLRRSETVASDTGGNQVHASRTSEGMFFERGENDLCERLERRIASLFQWPVDHGEGLQILRYGPGAEYRPHYDFFDPAQKGAEKILQRGGQRVATLILYLNTPQQGGATVFPDAGLEVLPIKGHAVFFGYAHADATSLTLHGGAPVIQGEKWIATKWFRERRFV